MNEEKNLIRLFATARLRDGKLDLPNRQGFADKLKLFGNCDVVITIAPKKTPRTLSQNAYYHGVVIPAIRSALLTHGTQVSVQEVKDLLQEKAMPLYYVLNEDEESPTPLTSSKLSTDEFEEFMTRCRLWAYDTFGIQIPLPNEDLTLTLNTVNR